MLIAILKGGRVLRFPGYASVNLDEAAQVFRVRIDDGAPSFLPAENVLFLGDDGSVQTEAGDE